MLPFGQTPAQVKMPRAGADTLVFYGATGSVAKFENIR